MANGNFGGGDGTETNPFLVEDRADFEATEPYPYHTYHYKQVKDIDFGGTNYEPIGYRIGDGFGGVYNGNGFKIKNLTISSNDGFTGLWKAIVSGGVFKNITVEGVNINGDIFTGAICAQNMGEIINCKVLAGSVSGADYVGGLAGAMFGGKISNCQSEVNTNGNERVGGLVGGVEGQYGPAEITNSFAIGKVNGSSSVGGFIGSVVGNYSYQDVISNCYSVGLVEGASRVGGFIGEKTGNLSTEIISCYYDSQTSSQSDTGRGEPRTTAQMKQRVTFVNWDFSNVWTIGQGKTYPYFKRALNAFIKKDNQWRQVDAVFKKIKGQWKEADMVSVKVNNEWKT